VTEVAVSIEILACAEGAIAALLETGVLNPHERYHVLEVRDRIERAVTRQREAQQTSEEEGRRLTSS
jgi:hypothetical protein